MLLTGCAAFTLASVLVFNAGCGAVSNTVGQQ
jgi:hypothetical protein